MMDQQVILKLLCSLVLAALLLPGGTWFCRVAAKRLKSSKNQTTELADAGKLIGYFERAIITGAVLVSSWELIAVVIALKTAARYKDLDEKIPAEYFLIGSLASLSWALLWSELLKRLWT